MLIVVVLSVVTLSAVTLNVVGLNVMAPLWISSKMLAIGLTHGLNKKNGYKKINAL